MPRATRSSDPTGTLPDSGAARVQPETRDGVRAAEAELARSLAEARGLRESRERALDLIARLVPFDAAGVHALSPRVPLETGVFRGLDLARMAASMPDWDDFAVDFARLRQHALQRGGVAADHEVFTTGTRAHARWSTAALQPQGLRSVALVHLVVGGTVHGVVGLGRRVVPRFEPLELATLRALAPTLALADVAHAGLESTPTARLPARLICRDERLTARQRTIVEHVALGHTNAEIASALGVSPNTLRNQLAVVFRRVGASNRAELVRIAVLQPAGTNVPVPA